MIVCTGEKGRSTATTLGATEFVAKPFTGDQLREAVARQLSAERSSVLVVDDDIALRRLVIETLARDGGELREAADGLEALAMIAVRRPDVLVLDLAMPKLDGFGVLERLLERAETRQLPVVVLTGARADRRRARACCASATACACSRSASTRATSCAGSSARRSARTARRSRCASRSRRLSASPFPSASGGLRLAVRAWAARLRATFGGGRRCGSASTRRSSSIRPDAEQLYPRCSSRS